jgi:cell division protein FtsB
MMSDAGLEAMFNEQIEDLQAQIEVLKDENVGLIAAIRLIRKLVYIVDPDHV